MGDSQTGNDLEMLFDITNIYDVYKPRDEDKFQVSLKVWIWKRWT